MNLTSLPHLSSENDGSQLLYTTPSKCLYNVCKSPLIFFSRPLPGKISPKNLRTRDTNSG
ncbi:hypothetical protein LguiB_012646 [Lonicera macranthoides]